jgi:bacteriocin biosynthesis cyclodehydratase domain-containing protein
VPVNDLPSGAEFGLGPATRLLWRSPESVHLELGDRAVVVDGLPTDLVRRIAAASPPAKTPVELDRGSDPALADLADGGYLWPRAPGDDRLRMPPEPRLTGELAALAVRHGTRAAGILRARREAMVEITGRSRVATQLGTVLAASGVGRVHCAADGVARLHQVAPAGIAMSDEGDLLSVATERALRRVAPQIETAPPEAGRRPQLTILAVDGPVPDERYTALHAADAPYLTVSLGVHSGVVGPLVVPGLTSCLGCADLHRRDRDPAWPALAVQLTVQRRYGPASSAAVATIIAGVAAQQALAFLDGDEPACVEGTIELHLPDWRLRRRSWPPHPECRCVASDDQRG